MDIVNFNDIRELNNESTIIDYIKENPDILTKTDLLNGQTLLIYAIKDKNYRIDIIEKIIALIGDMEKKYINSRKNNKVTPLISLKGQLNYKDRFENTPLLLSFKSYNYKKYPEYSNFSESFKMFVKLLTENGANPNLEISFGETYLTYALEDYEYKNKKHVRDIAKILIEFGANPNLPNSSNFYPIEYAIESDDPKFIEFLLENGATFPDDHNNIYKKLDIVNHNSCEFSLKGYEFLFEKYLRPYSDIQQDKNKYQLISVDTIPINNLTKYTKNAQSLNTMTYTKYSEESLYFNYKKYINKLDDRDKYNLKQYTFHGDKIVNSMLNLIDTIKLYEQNIMGHSINIPAKYVVDNYINVQLDTEIMEDVCYLLDETKTWHEIFFIFYYILFDFQIEGLVKKFPNLKMKYYITNIIPQLHKIMNNLDLLREMTYNYFKGLDRIITLFPKMSYPFIVYRGVEQNYLFVQNNVQNNDDIMSVSYLSTFTSTTRSKKIALTFFIDNDNPIIYTFYVHPQCRYAPIESISRFQDEKEILFAPYHRYIFMSHNFHDNVHNCEFAVLPGDITPPDNYNDYKVWKEKYNELQKKYENYKKLPNSQTKKGGRSIVQPVQPILNNTKINKTRIKNTKKNNIIKNIKIETKRIQNNRYKTKKNKMQPNIETKIVKTNEEKLLIKSRLETPIDVLFTRKSTDEEKKLALELYNYFKKK